MTYTIEVWCTGIGWAKSVHGGETLEEAQLAERLLREDNGAWVNPTAPKQTRIVANDKKSPGRSQG